MSLAVANSADEVHGQDGWVLKTVMRRDQAVKLCGSEDWLRKLVPDPGFINPQPRGEAELYGATRKLLERGQCFAGGLGSGRGTGCVVMNCSGLVAAEAADSGEILGDRSRSDQIRIAARRAAASGRCDRRSHSRKSKTKSAFRVWRRSDEFARQNRLMARG